MLGARRAHRVFPRSFRARTRSIGRWGPRDPGLSPWAGILRPFRPEFLPLTHRSQSNGTVHAACTDFPDESNVIRQRFSVTDSVGDSVRDSARPNFRVFGVFRISEFRSYRDHAALNQTDEGAKTQGERDSVPVLSGRLRPHLLLGVLR